MLELREGQLVSSRALRLKFKFFSPRDSPEVLGVRNKFYLAAGAEAAIFTEMV